MKSFIVTPPRPAVQGFDSHVVEMMLEALRIETAAQEDTPSAVLADPLRASLPQHAARAHTPARLPPIVLHSLRQAAAKLFNVRPSGGKFQWHQFLEAADCKQHHSFAASTKKSSAVLVTHVTARFFPKIHPCQSQRPSVRQDLELKDYARLDGWVLLPLSTEGMDVQPEGSEEEADAADAELEKAGEEAVKNRTLQVRPPSTLVLRLWHRSSQPCSFSSASKLVLVKLIRHPSTTGARLWVSWHSEAGIHRYNIDCLPASCTPAPSSS